MRDNKFIQAASVVVILSAAAALAVTQRGGFAPGINPEPHRAAGAMMAQLALSNLKPGGQIMVIARDTTAFPNPATELQMQSFQKELRQAGSAIGAIQTVQVDPLRLIEAPPEDFQRWIHHASEADVIVSFIGPPALTTAEQRQLGEIKPAVVAFCSGSWPDRIDFGPLFEHGLLRAAVVSRRDQPPATVKPKTRAAWFNQNFAVITATNLDDLASMNARQSGSATP